MPEESAAIREVGVNNKTIILFSDGTGNSSAKLFKTNVWRLYEAVDLGPMSGAMRDQIAYYDNGVGNSAFRPLRLLQGVFGIGLKRNVLEIYRYACRNYEPGPGQRQGECATDLGDHFYGFGFSRGAFTMRLAIDLIATEGIVAFDSESEFIHKTNQAFRNYCWSGPQSGLKALPTRLLRLIRAPISRLFDYLRGIPPYSRANNYQPAVKFIGVWDTVSAYGGPSVEITRGIDTFIYPLSMPNYRLNPGVQKACHALALDDERDSFHPLLWDEIEEAELTKSDRIAPGRLEQVWFTGMHADVGGGYPDESLSYVSLLWMMARAERAGLRFHDVITERYVALANAFGPVHDSRAGLASYYRYQPRKLAALLDEPDARERRRTLSLRDPAIRNGTGPSHALLREVKVHESVIARIADGTDGYAPIVLPARFGIVRQDLPAVARKTKAVPDALVGDDLCRKLEAGREMLSRGVERAWNFVWARRIVYFVTVAATIALLTLPLWGDWNPLQADDGKLAFHETVLPRDDRNWLGNLIRLPTAVLPEFLHPWVEAVARSPYWLLWLIVLILALNWIARRLERALRGRVAAHWNVALGKADGPAAEAPSRLARLRTGLGRLIERVRDSHFYQGSLALLKWYLLPFLIGLILLALIMWAGLALYTQIRLPGLEAGSAFCESRGQLAEAARHQSDFRTDALCNRTGLRMRRGQRYVITFDVGEDWKDGPHRADPTGLGAFGVGWTGPFGVPLRRVVDAGYLQPLAATRAGEIVQIEALELAPVEGSTSRFRGTFEARLDGELFLFVNDAVLPFAADPTGLGLTHGYFYTGRLGRNSGDACVTVEIEGAVGERLPAPPADSVCAKTAREAAQQAAQEAPPAGAQIPSGAQASSSLPAGGERQPKPSN